MTLGALTAIMVYLSQLIRMQGSFANFFQTTVLGLVSCERIDRVLDEKPRVIEVQGAKEAVFKKGEILFKGVSFGYKPRDFVLKDISFRVEGGSHIALVDASGCGKTTILNLILRLYDPWEGEIIIDGHKIKDLRFSSLRGQIGIALQEPFLLNDTVKRNISYGENNADDKEIVEVARICTAHDFTIKLPDKYQTVIGENASKISQGQKTEDSYC
ncbi:MAG: ABC transporter ATP-binding protein [Nitrospirota bacterium]